MGKQRKTKYDKIAERLDIIAAWKRNGLTDEEVWERLGISKNTFYKYKNEHKEFCDSLKNAREEADLIVENTAFKMATGYFVKVGEEEKYIPPNPTMTIFWLRNRKSSEWNKQVGNIGGGNAENTGGVIEIPMADMEVVGEAKE